jgi:two-component system KDP operon response regulator KdpE
VVRKRQILLVGPADERLRALAAALGEAGFDVLHVARLEGAAAPDLALVDVRDNRRWDVAALLAGERLVLLVDGPAGMRRGFELGAEDCVVPEAHIEEIVARCEAVLRRTDRRPIRLAGDPAVYVDGRLWVNFDSRQVWVGGRPAQLTPREFRLLRFLVRHRDTTLSHEAILQEVWGREPDSRRPTEVLKQYVWRLRQKIEPDPEQPESIVTDPGAGYRFTSHPA